MNYFSKISFTLAKSMKFKQRYVFLSLFILYVIVGYFYAEIETIFGYTKEWRFYDSITIFLFFIFYIKTSSYCKY